MYIIMELGKIGQLGTQKKEQGTSYMKLGKIIGALVNYENKRKNKKGT